jgi:hypothetical protein
MTETEEIENALRAPEADLEVLDPDRKITRERLRLMEEMEK